MHEIYINGEPIPVEDCVYKAIEQEVYTKSGCKYYKNGHCTSESREEELSNEILKLNQEIKLLQSDNQSLKNMIVKMCYDRYGE